MHYDLTLIAVVVTVALLGGLAVAHVKQPPVLGYILTGVLLGPSGVAFIESRDAISELAELGVLLLLFVLGMELSLRTFKKVWVTATLCTLLQIVISVFITFVLAGLFEWNVALFVLLGFVVALSSTAVVVKMLESMNELKSDVGQLAIGILIAQDLAIIPMILIVRNFGEATSFSFSIILKIAIAMGLTAFIIHYLSQRQRVRLPLDYIVSGERELTPLASLAFCFGAAAFSGMMGLSAPYGAFLAGIILGNTHERTAMLDTVKPIQNILLMVFFLSIGLLLDVGYVWKHFTMVMSLLLLISFGKTFVNIGVLRFLNQPWSHAFLIGAVLAQLGEFAFLLATVSYDAHIIDESGQKLIIGLTVLSLIFSPFWMTLARRLKDLVEEGPSGLRMLLKQLIKPPQQS